MQRPIRLSLSLAGTAALALASLPFDIRPVVAQEAPAAAEEPKVDITEAADLGVMGVSLKDAVKFNWGFQGALQGAGTPNQAGVGAFIPLSIGSNSVLFLDTLANVNFSDFSDYSSIINTKVKGATVSTSTRLGYRWLNKDRSWMFGVNAGYDSRPLATGGTDNGVPVTDSQTVFFQQVALNLEAVSNKWFTSAYLLYPIGKYGYNKAPAKINDFYYADSVMTVGADIGYNLTPRLKASVGYYYSEGDAGAANGNSVKGRLEYNIANGLTSGINIAYDPVYSEGYSSGEFYKTLNLSLDLKWRFGANGYGAPSIRKQQPVVMPVIQALSTTPANRDVRVHDIMYFNCEGWLRDSSTTWREVCERQDAHRKAEQEYTEKMVRQENDRKVRWRALECVQGVGLEWGISRKAKCIEDAGLYLGQETLGVGRMLDALKREFCGDSGCSFNGPIIKKPEKEKEQYCFVRILSFEKYCFKA